MSRILLLGAGLVSGPMITYLMDVDGFELTVATRTVSKAERLVGDHPSGRAVSLDVSDAEAMDALIRDHDLTISLLPWTLHVAVAERCLSHGKHMVTTSYVSDGMQALDAKVREAGLIFLNEIGVDPGIDHMSAMAVIDAVKSAGGTITSFTSCCGGLPAPHDNNNPFGYKFSWSPRGVVLASRNSARFQQDGELREIPGHELFANPWTHSFEAPVGDLEMYPNRDSTRYAPIYGLEQARTLIRGTYRNPGWCRTFKAFGDLGILADDARPAWVGKTAREAMAMHLGCYAAGVEDTVANKLGVALDDPILDRMRWVGLFSDAPVPRDAPNLLDTLCALMLDRMTYADGEQDMIVMRHDFEVAYEDGRREAIKATLIDYGLEGGASSMARTVSLPAAIAVRMILKGEITRPGVQIPTAPHVYEPVLAELESMGIAFEETREVLV